MYFIKMLQNTLLTFINGIPGYELAIKTLPQRVSCQES
jgi:hypothetical protein